MGFLAIVNAPVVAFSLMCHHFCASSIKLPYSGLRGLSLSTSKHLARHTTGYTTGDTTTNTAMEIATNASRDTSGFTAWYASPPELLQHLLAPSTPEGV